MTGVYDKFVDILTTRFEVERDEIRPEVTFEELDLDSLFVVELLLVLEKEFGVKISDEHASSRSTLGSVATVIEDKLAKVS